MTWLTPRGPDQAILDASINGKEEEEFIDRHLPVTDDAGAAVAWVHHCGAAAIEWII